MKAKLFVAGIAVLLAAEAQAQRPPVGRAVGQVSAVFGPSPYDLSGTGTGLALNVGFAYRPLRRILVLETNLGYFRYTAQFGTRIIWLFPEISVAAEAHLGRFSPYLGGGVGRGRGSGGGSTVWETTIHGIVGARVALGSGWGLRAEVRARGVGPTEGSTMDFGFGLTYRVVQSRYPPR